jgi:NAD(P)-dependent dehydrogenase (short-subunit alcohol dehydrogenase family)
VDLKLAKKRVLVTGASQGIGAAIARAFGREGSHLLLTARSNERLAALKASIERDSAASVEIYPADLTVPSVVHELVDRCGPVDVLVNNAGAVPKGSILDLDEESWRSGWELKLFGYIRMTREFYRGMVQRGTGVIINVIGFTAERLLYDYVAGSSANACLVAFTRAIGSASLDRGVRVLGVNPGYTKTERAEKSFKLRAERELGSADRWEELVRRELPNGRMITPEEIADIVVFLSSVRANAISGHIVTADAGVAARSYAEVARV